MKMNKLDKQYTDLLQDILDNGVTKQDRTGTGTLSVFGRHIRHKMSDGFPLLTTKKVHFKSVVTELLWFLRGDTNIKYLVDNDCHIWNGDAYKRYYTETKDLTKETLHVPFQKTHLFGTFGGSISNGYFRPYTQEEFINKIKTDDEFTKKWGELGPVYGKQWRKWTQYKIDMPGFDAHFDETETDQIANSINLLKTNPDSRRNRVNAWNVGELDEMVLPPCHTDFQFFTRVLSEDEKRSIFPELNEMYLEKKNHIEHYDFDGAAFYREKEKSLLETLPTRAISLMWNQRSVDTFLGLPFNIASYGLLLEIIAKEVNMVPDELIGNLGDTHLYLNHIEQAKEQIGKLSWEERKEFLSNEQFKEFGNISPFTDKMIHWWLDCLNIPYSKRMPYPLPKLHINDEFWSSTCLYDTPEEKYKNVWPDLTPHSMAIHDFTLENYQSHPAIKAPLSN